MVFSAFQEDAFQEDAFQFGEEPPPPPPPPITVVVSGGHGRGWTRWPSVPAWVNPFALLRQLRRTRHELEHELAEEEDEGYPPAVLAQARELIEEYEAREAVLALEAASSARARARRRADEALLLGIKEDDQPMGWRL